MIKFTRMMLLFWLEFILSFLYLEDRIKHWFAESYKEVKAIANSFEEIQFESVRDL